MKMRDKNKLKLLYKLENLVLANGDKNEIENLRKQLGVHARKNNHYSDFCPDEYRKMKAAGMLDKDIIQEWNMSQSGLYKNKIKYGLF